MIAAADICPPYGLFDQADNAYGHDAKRVKEELDAVETGFDVSVFYSGNAQTVLAELGVLAASAVEDNWDGEGGSQISAASLNRTLSLIRKMPREWPAPNVDLDSDGEVMLQWLAGPGHRLTVSVGADGRLSYAWMVPNGRGGIERNYGVAEAQGAFPKTISDVISQFAA